MSELCHLFCISSVLRNPRCVAMSWLSHCDSTITPPSYYYVSFTSRCLLAGNPHSSAATFRTHWSFFIWKRLSSVHRCPTVLPIKPNSSGIKNGQSWSKGQPLPWPRSPPPPPPVRRTWKSCVDPPSSPRRSWTSSTARSPRRSWCPIPRPCAGTTSCPGSTRTGWGGPRPSSTSRLQARRLPRHPWFFSAWVRDVFRPHTWICTCRNMIGIVCTLTPSRVCKGEVEKRDATRDRSFTSLNFIRAYVFNFRWNTMK